MLCPLQTRCMQQSCSKIGSPSVKPRYACNLGLNRRSEYITRYAQSRTYFLHFPSMLCHCTLLNLFRDLRARALIAPVHPSVELASRDQLFAQMQPIWTSLLRRAVHPCRQRSDARAVQVSRPSPFQSTCRIGPPSGHSCAGEL
jgi:hypothetical protein